MRSLCWTYAPYRLDYDHAPNFQLTPVSIPLYRPNGTAVTAMIVTLMLLTVCRFKGII